MAVRTGNIVAARGMQNDQTKHLEFEADRWQLSPMP